MSCSLSSSNKPVPFVKFKLLGKQLNSNGKILTTNSNGEINVNGLLLNEEYTLQEIKANGYYLEEIKLLIEKLKREDK